jgi:RTX calcium-binding nonapeptide repeat (4 copies)
MRLGWNVPFSFARNKSASRRALGVSLVLLAAHSSGLASAATVALSATQCLARSSIDVLPPSPTTQFVRNTFPDNHTFDARAQVNTLYPSVQYPVDVGSTNGGRNACFLGGVFMGQQSRDLTWEDVKDIGGAPIQLQQPGGAVVNGLQVDNIEDGIELRSADPSNPNSGDGWVLENSYMTYIRDDAVADDDMSTGKIVDVLFDGVYVGFSADRDGSQPDQSSERIVFDHAVIRLQEMPSAQYGMDTGDLLKWHPYAPRPVIRDSVFYVEDSAAGDWPAGTVIENSILVWNGEGTLSLGSMPGLRITTNLNVWRAARQDWLDRHGCTSFGNCSRLTDPIPPGTSLTECKGYDATILGTKGEDRLVGTTHRDVIIGLAGNDVISGRGGRDLICSGEGKDVVEGNSGKDRLWGQGEGDALNGGAGFDVCNGGPGRDRGRGCEAEQQIP